jgi:hypothetical protein
MHTKFGRLERKRSFGGPMRIWEDNIRMNLKGNSTGRCGLDAPGSG